MGRTEAKSGLVAKRPMATTSGASLPRDVSVLSIVADFEGRDLDGLRRQWRAHLGGEAPAHLRRWLLMRVLAYPLQSDAFGDLDKTIRRNLRSEKDDGAGVPFDRRAPQTRQGVALKAGALLVREWKGRLERVMILEQGFAWNGQTFGSLSQIAKAMTGTNWNGHRFFGLRQGKVDAAGHGRDRRKGDASGGARKAHGAPRSLTPNSCRHDERDAPPVQRRSAGVGYPVRQDHVTLALAGPFIGRRRWSARCQALHRRRKRLPLAWVTKTTAAVRAMEVNPEAASVCRDCMVERRGFKLMVIVT